MNAKTLVLGSCFALLAACSGAITGDTTGTNTTTSSSTAGSGGSTSTSGSPGTTASGTTGSGGATTGSGGSGAGGGCAIDPTFAEVLAKPLSGCAGYEPPCHNAGAGMLHIDKNDAKATWGALVNVSSAIAGAGKRVVPGDPAHSFLYRKLVDNLKPTEGAPMPKSGVMTGWNELPADQIELLRCWILAGAKNN